MRRKEERKEREVAGGGDLHSDSDVPLSLSITYTVGILSLLHIL